MRIGDCFGLGFDVYVSTISPRNDMHLTTTQLLQLIMQFPPLDLGDPKLLADLIRFLAGAVII